MAWLIGMATRDEIAELKRRGWEVEPPTPGLFEAAVTHDIGGESCSDEDDPVMIQFFVDSDVFQIASGPDWDKGDDMGMGAADAKPELKAETSAALEVICVSALGDILVIINGKIAYVYDTDNADEDQSERVIKALQAADPSLVVHQLTCPGSLATRGSWTHDDTCVWAVNEVRKPRPLLYTYVYDREFLVVVATSRQQAAEQVVNHLRAIGKTVEHVSARLVEHYGSRKYPYIAAL